MAAMAAEEAVLFAISVFYWIFNLRHSKSEIYKWLWIFH